jgi:prepilin-type processing-associated H-X9-DG protein
VSRVRQLAFRAFLCLAVPTAVLGADAMSGHAQALAAEPTIDVGTELMATTDVTLHKAEIAKGSRVSVTKVSRSGGQVDTLNVALADGHVVKVTMAQVHTYFQVVNE